MATVEECESALQDLAKRLEATDPETRSRHLIDRTLACTLTDLRVTFLGVLGEDGLRDIRRKTADDEPAQLRLKANSDDLMALLDGELSFASAWVSGRIKVDASITDLMRLRSLL
jgi:hypothetical protein